jgi:hypothetical protein
MEIRWGGSMTMEEELGWTKAERAPTAMTMAERTQRATVAIMAERKWASR